MKAIHAVKKNDAKTAETAYHEALSIRPDDPSALAGLAEIQLSQNRLDEAVKTIEKAYSLHETDLQVRYVFGETMLRARKRTADAIEAWKALMAEDPELAKQLGIPERLKAIEQLTGQ